MSREPEYPTDEEIEQIKNWDVVSDTKGLIDFVRSLWRFGEDWCPYTQTKKEWRLELHTAGWSGNKAMIGALQSNTMFWLLYWQRSDRGGHFYFEGDIKK